MNTFYKSPFGNFDLVRYPLFPKSKAQQNLQAWDGADTYILEALKERGLPENGRTLILNDSFGAMSCALAKGKPNMQTSVQTDSFLSRTAILENLERNDISPDSVRLIDSTSALQGTYDLVVMRVPKSLSFLEHQLYSLKEHVNANTVVIACAMAKALSKNTRGLFEQILGPAQQSLAAHRARLIECSPEPKSWSKQSPFPRTFKAHGIELLCHANVFAEGRVDPGTQVFIEHLALLPKAESLIDLACGNGVMGILTAKAVGAQHAYFCDESFMAVASAQANADSQLTNCTTHVEAGNAIPEDFPQVDLIVCNPPFHQQTSMGTDMAYAMFSNALQHLKPNGELWIIANRHLNYHTGLKRLFGNCTNRAKHAKYVLLQATKTAR